LSYLQEIKNKQLLNNNSDNKENDENNENNEKKEEKVDDILLNSKNNNNIDNGYNIIIGYINSRAYYEESPANSKKNINSKVSLNITDSNNNKNNSQFPLIDRNKNNNILYTERTYKIKDLNINLKNKKKMKSQKQHLNIPPDYQLLYDKLNKHTVVSKKKELDPYSKFQRYLKNIDF
jgi:hypothetical protein